MDNYEKKFINRGKKLVDNQRLRQGNSTSFAHPNHSGKSPHSGRIAEKQFLKHTQQFILYDINPDGGRMNRKNIGNYGVGFKVPHVNITTHQTHNQPQISSIANKELKELRFFQVSVSDSKSIGICDYDSLSDALALGKFQQLIYFDYAWKFPRFSIPTIYSRFNEHTCDYSNFQKTLSQLCDNIKENPNTIICCKRGVNRSITLLMFYLINNCGYTYDMTHNLVENEKSKVSKRWNNLTNNKLKNFLRLLKMRDTESFFP